MIEVGTVSLMTNGPEVPRRRYERAERMLPWNAELLLPSLTLDVQWSESGERCWYETKTGDGRRFYRVEVTSGEKREAFDIDRLARGLTIASGTPYSATRLPLIDVRLEGDGSSVEFDADGQRWSCDLATYTCEQAPTNEEPTNDVVRSPDGRWEASIRDHNLWLRSIETGEERAITTDGTAERSYGSGLPSPLASARLDDPAPPAVIWSPDSSRLVTIRIDSGDALKFHLVQSVPLDGATRPELHSYAYPLPGDEQVPLASFIAYDLASGESRDLSIDPVQLLYYGSPLSDGWCWWAEDNRHFFLVQRDRGYKRNRLIRADTDSGEAVDVIDDASSVAIDVGLSWGAPVAQTMLDDTYAIWYSQADGWGHLYLHEASRGELVRQLTAGPYEVAEICHIDEQARHIYFLAIGREAGRDPYYHHLYSVELDGGEPVLLTPEDADHRVSFSPDGKHFIDSYSTVDSPPVHELRTADGALIAEFEWADIEALLATGYRSPQRFRAKARDGVTDVYGVLLRPSHLDPAESYPVIDYIYGGPQVNQAPVSFADAARGRGDGFWHAQAIAELGFVVVMVDGLGMPGRSKAYHDVSYRDLGDGGIADHISAIRQLGDRYAYLDLERVGIFGHSAGGYASAQAIFSFPDFYKVCVSSAGNHDHRLDKASWVERYMGFEVEDHYREQANQTIAHQLEGKLLLIHGEMDENVHVASTLVVVDALIEANKDFDLLIMPNRTHACGNDPYFIRRRWDYFVRHLLGVEPPDGYRIAPDSRAS